MGNIQKFAFTHTVFFANEIIRLVSEVFTRTGVPADSVASETEASADVSASELREENKVSTNEVLEVTSSADSLVAEEGRVLARTKLSYNEAELQRQTEIWNDRMEEWFAKCQNVLDAKNSNISKIEANIKFSSLSGMELDSFTAKRDGDKGLIEEIWREYKQLIIIAELIDHLKSEIEELKALLNEPITESHESVTEYFSTKMSIFMQEQIKLTMEESSRRADARKLWVETQSDSDDVVVF